VLGRLFSPEEDLPGAEPVVVLSHGADRTNFEVNVSGRTVTVSVNTWGSSNVRVAKTEVEVEGGDVLILPWNIDPAR
jgi:hypothetical protein